MKSKIRTVLIGNLRVMLRVKKNWQNKKWENKKLM